MEIVLRGGQLIDGRGGDPVPDPRVVIEGNWIRSVGKDVVGTRESHGQTIDVGAGSILPGMIDLHTHSTYYYDEPEMRDLGPRFLQRPDAMVALLAASRLMTALQAGTTGVRDVGAVNEVIFDVKRAIGDGIIMGPRLWAAGRMITVTGGPSSDCPGLTVQADGPYVVRRAVRREVRAGADFIKLASACGEFSQLELNAAVDEAHRLNKRVACHAGEQASIKMALEAGVDTLEHASYLTPEDIELMVERGVVWVPTGYDKKMTMQRCLKRLKEANLPKTVARQIETEYKAFQDRWRALQIAVKHAHEAGLGIGAGTDVIFHGWSFAAIVDEIETLSLLGLPLAKAIRAATLVAAEAMGCEDRLGTIEAGKLADIIVVDGNPLEDVGALRRVMLVIKDGEVVRNELPKCSR